MHLGSAGHCSVVLDPAPAPECPLREGKKQARVLHLATAACYSKRNRKQSLGSCRPAFTTAVHKTARSRSLLPRGNRNMDQGVTGHEQGGSGTTATFHT